MNKEQFEENIGKIHKIFEENEKHLWELSKWISAEWSQREILDDFLNTLGLEKNSETRFATSARICSKHFEPLDIYLEKIWKSRQERDILFEASYIYVSQYYQKLQKKMLDNIRDQKLLPDFYMCIFTYTHKLWKLYSDLFLKWNRKLLFEQNRSLEEKFEQDSDAILASLQEHNLFDTGHHSERADRCYSLLIEKNWKLLSQTYAAVFPQEVGDILSMYDEFIGVLLKLNDEVYDAKEKYIKYFKAIKLALWELDPNLCVEKWTDVDIAWMAINTPVQPGHMMEYYEDKYRKAVAIEFDLRLDDPSLFTSTVSEDIEAMYETMYDEIGRDNFPESYKYSLQNQKSVGLHIWAPVLQYGAFLCGAYSAQVVPNDDEVSKVHGKKIFAFPKFVLESKRLAPKMKLDTKIFSQEILEKYYDFLHRNDESFYKVYDTETIGHEFGHTLWLTPGCEVKMNESGQFKNIEEFKATAGGLVAYFFSASIELNEVLLLDHIMRCVKMMRYRGVEDVTPYYCECLIHLHILFESEIISYESGKIELHNTDENFETLKNLYTATYTQQIFTYLNQMDAMNFLGEFTLKEEGIFFPKDKDVRKFIDTYYKLYKKIGNDIQE